jgi:hypothetical protein
MKWFGPFRLRNLIENSINDNQEWPPDHNGVYVISKENWQDEPSQNCFPLYAGGTTGKSKRFSTRIGDLIADMLGFFNDDTGHHSGGQTLHEFCYQNKINPLDLYIGWAGNCNCFRCAEVELVKNLSPKLNKKAPARCPKHNKQN